MTRTGGSKFAFRFRIGLILPACLWLGSCGGGGDESTSVAPPTPTTNVAGVLQKGPFVSGSTVTVQTLDTSLNPTGTSFSTTTTNDGGTFSVINVPQGSTIEVSGTGFYFDEITNSLSSAQISVNALAQTSASSQTAVNSNVLTALIAQRIEMLVGGGMAFSDAKTQAESEAVVPFGVPTPSSGFETLNYAEGSADDAELLAVSAIIQQAAVNSASSPSQIDAQLTQFISQFAGDLADNGKIDTPALLNQISDAVNTIAPASVQDNLTAYYAGIGQPASVPSFASYISPTVVVPSAFATAQTVDSGLGAGITMSADGAPHIFYTDLNQANLRHAYLGASGWQTEAVAPGSQELGAWPISVAVDRGGNFQVVGANYYYTNANAGATWSSAQIDTTDRPPTVNSSVIALSPSGTIGIAFLSEGQSPNTIYYATASGGSVTSNQLIAQTALGIVDPTISQSVCMAFDNDSNPHVFWNDRGTVTPGLRHATLSGGQWVVSTLDGQANVRGGCGVVVDQSGALHVSYLVGGASAQTLWAGTLSGGTWTTGSLNVATDAAETSPLQLNGGALAVVAATSANVSLFAQLKTFVASRVVSSTVSSGSSTSACVNGTNGQVAIALDFLSSSDVSTIEYIASN